MTLSSFVSLSVKVDWNNDGDFSDSGEDVSAAVRYPVTTSRGRSSATDQAKAGTGSFRLRNEGGDYTPFYASSPLYPNVLPGRQCQVQATYNAVTYDVFRGRCSPEDGRFAPDGDVSFAMVDAFEDFRKGQSKTALLETKRVDEIITTLLDDYGWSATLRDLDAAAQTIAIFTNASYLEPTLNALQRAAKQEAGGAFFMSKAGKARFQNRYYRAARPVLATLTRTFDSLVPSLRQEDLVDAVRGAYARFTIASTLSIAYTLSAPGRPLYPGADARNRFEGTFNGSGAKATVTPVAVTDYNANSAADGSGTDKTAQVTVSSYAATSRGFSILFNNLDSSVVYLYGTPVMQVRGYAVSEGTEDNVITATVASPIVTGQTLDEEFEHNNDASTVLGWVNWQRSVRGQMQPRLMLELTPDTDALMVAVLNAELGDRLRLDDTGAPFLTQISGDYFIEAIEQRFEGPGEVRTRWTLLPGDLAAGSFFRISGAAGGGADYSQIAAATATTGDRIAY